MKEGFYKNDNGIMLYAPNFVISANYELCKEQHDSHSYPIDGWKWFDDEDAAYLEFGLEKNE